MKLMFSGAAHEVTASCHYLDWITFYLHMRILIIPEWSLTFLPEAFADTCFVQKQPKNCVILCSVIVLIFRNLKRSGRIGKQKERENPK